MNRPPHRWSSVIAAIAVAAAPADICTIDVPSREPLGVRTPPGERGQPGRPVRLGRPHRVESQSVGLLDRVLSVPAGGPDDQYPVV